MAATAAGRRGVGWALLYDPTGTIDPIEGVERVGWSPVNACRTWDGALMTADAMVRSSRGGRLERDHWTERASSLLAPLLHAACLTEEPMSTVLSWVDRHQGEEALARLVDRGGDQQSGIDVLSGILATDAREQSGIWSTASGVLSAYRYSTAAASTRPPFLDTDAFLDGPNTLYVCAPGRMQELVAPLVVGVLSELRHASYLRAARTSSKVPLLLALDEVANIAPLPDLPSLVTEGAGQGLLTLACLQDLSQARRRWGTEAESFLSIFGCTLVLPGIADMATLDALSKLAGEVEVSTRTVATTRGFDGRRRPSLSVSTTFRPRLSVDVIGQGHLGMALSLDARNRLGWVQMTPSYAAEPWAPLVGRSRDRPPRDGRDMGR